MNEVINRVTHHQALTPIPRPLTHELTGEFLVDTTITYIPTCGSKYNASMVFDGTNYLVVWVDLRTSQFKIYGTRVSQTGVILDPAGILISTATYNQYSPSVAFDGSNYFVVWIDTRTGYIRDDIYGARVSQSGVVLDTNGIPISATTYDEQNPSVAFDGTNYLVIWNDNRNGNCDVYGARVSPTGVILDPNGIALSTAVDDQVGIDIAFDGTNYLVVWSDERNGNCDIYGTRVSQAGVVHEPNGIGISVRPDYQACPSVAFDGTNYLVVWDDNRSGPSEDDIYGTLVNQAGIVLDTAGVAISTATHIQTGPSIAFDGLNYLVVWSDYRHHNGPFYFPNIYGTRVTQSIKVLDTLGIAFSDTSEEEGVACIAFGDSNYLIVGSREQSRSNNEVYGTRVSPSGSMLDPDGFSISTAANDQYSPSAAFDGTNYLLVWYDFRKIIKSPFNCGIFGTRISQTGNILDPTGINITADTSCQIDPSVAFDGANYLVVWEDYRNDPLTADIYGARVNQSGIVLDPDGIAISTARYEQILPSVAFDGTDYLVVWEDCRNVSRDIYGAQVTQTGTVLDTNGIEISTASNYQYCSAVAFDGTNYLVVWVDYRGYDGDIHGARVSPYGIVLDTISIAITNDTILQGKVNICFDGTNYLVVWQDYRNDPFSWDFYGAIVNPSGIVVDSFAVSLQPGNQLSPALVHGAGNQMLITYTSWTESINGNPANAMRIWGKFYPFVGISEGNLKVKMQSAKLFEVYPNPAKGVMRVRGTFSEKTIKIFDVAGKLVKVAEKVTIAQGHKQEVRISLKGINPGIYFLRLGKETKKFLVVK